MAEEHPTVAEYCVSRLADLGIRHVFGVPGDFAFPIDDAVVNDSRLTWISNSNELNAAYSADGYSRVLGVAALSTTYGVGELSALNGVFGSKAERCVVFHIVGAPSTRLTRLERALHHSTGTGHFTNEFFDISAAAACVSTSLTPENAVSEMERIIRTALRERKPAYIQVHQDYANMKIIDTPIKGMPLDEVPPPISESKELQAATSAIANRLRQAEFPILLPSFILSRYKQNLQEKLGEFLQKTGIPFATTSMDKSVLPETHPCYFGMYKGDGSSPAVLAAIQQADLIIDFGGIFFDDLSTGFGTTHISKDKLITISPHFVSLPGKAGNVQRADLSYSPVWIGDVLDSLLLQPAGDFKFTHGETIPRPVKTPINFVGEDLINFPSMAKCMEQFLQPNDTLVLDTGTVSFTLSSIILPENCMYINQTLWGSIGYATPGGGLGVALADTSKRVIMVTGDGAHQMTAQEIGVINRYPINPILIIVNNGVYGIEEFLEKNKMCVYNAIAAWNYAQLPSALGCQGWYTKTVATVGEFLTALAQARAHTERPSLIEVVIEGLMSPMASALLEKAYQVYPQ